MRRAIATALPRERTVAAGIGGKEPPTRTSPPTGKVADVAFPGPLAPVGVAAVAAVGCLAGTRHLLRPRSSILGTTSATLRAFCLPPSPERDGSDERAATPRSRAARHRHRTRAE